MNLTSRLVGGLRSRQAEDGSDAQAGQELSGDLAAALVKVFEVQGSGWFWATDRNERLVYLSGKVAKQLERDGQRPIGRALTELLEVNEGAGSERTLHFHLTARTSFSNFEVRSTRGGTGTWSITGRPLAR
jgi:hypothetical protein